MGWYMDPSFNWEEHGGSAPACSLSDKSKKEQTTPAPAKEEATPKTSGNTACPLPADSLPPPPPPDVDSIFHLCQKSKWEEAVAGGQPYFPPTYMNDGKFTRATVFKKDLVSTANEYYANVPGDWIVVELDCKMLYSLGIPILAQEAPESTPKQPVKCLQVFGGLSTSLPGLVKNIYKMHRSSSGRFVRIVDPPKPAVKEEEKKEEAPSKKSSMTRRIFGLKK